MNLIEPLELQCDLDHFDIVNFKVEFGNHSKVSLVTNNDALFIDHAKAVALRDWLNEVLS